MISEHWHDEDFRSVGGTAFGVGFTITWKKSPIRKEEEHLNQSGACVKDIIEVARDRLNWYQGGKYACRHFENASSFLGFALDALMAAEKGGEHIP